MIMARIILHSHSKTSFVYYYLLLKMTFEESAMESTKQTNITSLAFQIKKKFGDVMTKIERHFII